MNAPIVKIRPFETKEADIFRLRPPHIMSLVERKLGVILKSETRFKEEVDARKIFVFICRRAKSPVSVNRLAKLLGKDHSTLIHYQRVFPGNFFTDPDLRDMLHEVVGTIEYRLIEKEIMGAMAPSFKKQTKK